MSVFFSDTEGSSKIILASDKKMASAHFDIPRVGPKGEAPHVSADSATKVSVELHGYLIN